MSDAVQIVLIICLTILLLITMIVVAAMKHDSRTKKKDL